MLIDNIQGIGTHWWFELDDATEKAQFYVEFIQRVICDFEQAYSRFLPDSWVSRLNRDRSLTDPSEELLHILAIGKEFYQMTDGVFNPSLGGILENRGYDADYSFENKAQGEQVVSFDELVQISPDKIELIGPGNIDFGGFGKGFLIDKLVRKLREELGLQSFLINGGGDIYAAGEEVREIILENPFQPGYELLRINLKNQALGCSSNQKRAWRDTKTGEVQGHIIDPKNLEKNVEFGSFVVSDNALTADVMATVVCILGDEIGKIEKLQRVVDFEFMVVDERQEMVRSDRFFL
jgi:FAD:protein FMN transferase